MQVQLAPFASKSSKPFSRSEAATLQSALALAAGEVFSTHHAFGSTPLEIVLPPAERSSTAQGGPSPTGHASCGTGNEHAHLQNGKGSSASHLACMPCFVPVHSSSNETWLGAAFVGDTLVAFDTQIMQLPSVHLLSVQQLLQV